MVRAFQTGFKNNLSKNMSHFTHCDLINLKVFLNSEVYPYDNLNLDFNNNKFSILYEMYTQF